MNLTPYSKYKDSKVEWLGDVPVEWQVIPLKRIGRLKGGNSFPLELQGQPNKEFPFYKVGDLGKSPDGVTLGDAEHYISEEETRSLNANIFGPGSLVWAKVGAALLLNRRRVIRSTSCLDNNMTGFTLDPSVVSSVFYFHLLTQVDFAQYLKPGTVPSLSEGNQGEIKVVQPPLAEQQAIASFLDQETSRIDGLLNRYQALVDLLKEKRQALIGQVVTKGLNPDVRMKDSGVEWLGKVPEHWDVKSLAKITFSIKNGTSATQLDGESKNTIKVTRIETISEGHINFDKVGFVEWSSSLESYRLKRGDILISHINSLSMIGNCAIYSSDEPLFSGMNLLRIHPTKTTDPYWLWRALSSGGVRKEISSRAKPAINQASITTIQIKALLLPVPPLAEQQAIASFLDQETSKIDRLIETVNRSVELLKERRSALVTAAITGKIDLREAV